MAENLGNVTAYMPQRILGVSRRFAVYPRALF
jgi:hypothetical protein